MTKGIDTAVIMAGGAGMRLRPYTTILPKPLMPLGDKPLLEIVIRQLAASGIRRVVLSVNHLAHIIRAVMASIDFGEIEVTLVQEDQPLGTCGALALMRDLLPERFLVLNGDLLSDYPITHLIEEHVAAAAPLSIATKYKLECVAYGVVERNGDGDLVDYLEKPSRRYELGIGLYALERSCIDAHLSGGGRADMPDLIRSLLGRGEKVHAVPRECTWIDIGQPEDYVRAQELHQQQRDWLVYADKPGPSA